MDSQESVNSNLERSSVAEGVPSNYHEGSHQAARFLMLSSVRIFMKAIVALSKIGDVLIFSPSAEGMALRCFNKSRSAYAVFHFTAPFFSSFDVSQLNAEDNNSCRISMKSALAVFRCMHNAERSIYSCEIMMDPRLDSILVKMKYGCDITRCYEVPFLEPITQWKATWDKSQLANRIETSPEILAKILSSTTNDITELVMSVNKKEVVIRNYHPSEEDQMHTTMMMTLQPVNFSKFQLRKKTEITFLLKEFKALVVFANDLAVSLNLHFDKPGKPLIMCINGEMSYSAELLMGTVEGDEEEEEEEEEPMEEDDRMHQTIPVYNGEDVGLDDDDEDEEEEENEREKDDKEEEEEEETEERGRLEENEGGESARIVEEPLQENLDEEMEVIDMEEPRREESQKDPALQFRRFFMSTSQMTQHESQIHERARILANDSGSEEDEIVPFKRLKRTITSKKFAMPQLP